MPRRLKYCSVRRGKPGGRPGKAHCCSAGGSEERRAVSEGGPDERQEARMPHQGAAQPGEESDARMKPRRDKRNKARDKSCPKRGCSEKVRRFTSRGKENVGNGEMSTLLFRFGSRLLEQDEAEIPQKQQAQEAGRLVAFGRLEWCLILGGKTPCAAFAGCGDGRGWQRIG